MLSLLPYIARLRAPVISAHRTAAFDIVQEPFKHRIEVCWRFPERGMTQTAQTMTPAFPQICVGDRIEVIEIDDAVRAAVHYSERHGAALHGRALVHARAGTRGIEEHLAKLTIRARHGVVEELAGRFTKNRL